MDMIPKDFELEIGGLFYKRGRFNKIFIWLGDEWKISTMKMSKFLYELKGYCSAINKVITWKITISKNNKKFLSGAIYYIELPFHSSYEIISATLTEKINDGFLHDDILDEAPDKTIVKRVL